MSTWATYYCPAGTTTRRRVSAGHYTTPEDDVFTANREAQVACDSSSLCESSTGLRKPKLEWSGGSCDGGKRAVSVTEDVGLTFQPSASVLGTLTAQKHPEFTLSGSISYSVLSIKYHNEAERPDCAPSTPSKNGGMFGIGASDGKVRLLGSRQARLNYEVCDPDTDIRYLMTVKAQASGRTPTDSSNKVASIECTVEITVEDDNDFPVFARAALGQLEYRQIQEKVQKNTPVRRCDSQGGDIGCPGSEVGSDGPIEIVAQDRTTFCCNVQIYEQQADRPANFQIGFSRLMHGHRERNP